MIPTATLIAAVFRLLNFGIVIALITYLFKNKILPTIYNKIEQHNAALRQLAVQQESLQQREKELREDLKNNEQQVTALKQKIDYWSQSVAHQKQQQERTRELQQHYMQQQMERKTLHAAQEKAYKKIARNAVAAVEKQIKEQRSTEKGTKYFAHLINSLERGR